MVPITALQRTFRMQFNGETATCFTLDRYNKQYIVTARHALPDIGKYITIQLQHEGVWKDLDCRVVGNAPGEVDISVLAPPHAISPSEPFEPTTKHLQLGQDTFFLGFPYGLHAEVGDLNASFPLPLVKKACVSMLSLGARDTHFILLDGHNNPGFSGGPVIYSPPGSNSVCVAGVVAGYSYVWDKVYLGDNETDMTVRYNTGIITAYSIDYALDLIRTNPLGASLD